MGLWGKLRSAFGSGGTEDKAASPQDLFAAQVEMAIHEAFPAATVRRHGEAVGLLVDRGGKEQTVFLDNAFAETRDMGPEPRRERIARFVCSMDAPDASAMSWDEVRPKLAPLLRTPSLFGGVPGLVRDEQPLHRPFVPFLIECVGIDSDDGIGYAAPSMTAKWGVSTSDVFSAAVENGRAYFEDDVGPFDSRAPYPLWHVSRDDSYESSRLLVPGWLASFADKVKGRPVAIVPERSTLVVGGDADERCLRRLVESAKAEFQASPRRISPALYTVDGEGKVVPLVLPAAHPLAGDVAVGHVMMAIAEYDAQQPALQNHLGDGVFVASYKGLKGPSGAVFSYTTWTKGALSLLPKADHVALLTDPGKADAILRVAWQTLIDMVGDCLVQEPDLDPPRWRTTRWPEDDVLAKLQSVSIPE